MPIEKQASLTACNELFLRQALPLTYGNDEEKKLAKATAKTAEADALAKAKEPKLIADKVSANLLQRHFDELTGKQAAAAPTGEDPLVVTNPNTPAPEADDGLTPEQRAAVAAAKALGV